MAMLQIEGLDSHSNLRVVQVNRNFRCYGALSNLRFQAFGASAVPRVREYLSTGTPSNPKDHLQSEGSNTEQCDDPLRHWNPYCFVSTFPLSRNNERLMNT